MGTTDYRRRLYGNYYSSHVSGGNPEAEKSQFQWKSRRIFGEISPFLPVDRQSRILDIGCGNGALLFALQMSGYDQAEGIDLSEEQIAQARKNGIRRIQCADAGQFLRSNPGTYEVICAIDLLEHQCKDEAIELLDLIRTSLKPGGICIMRVPNADAPFGNLFAYGDFTHELILNKDSAMQLFRACNYHVEVWPSSIRTENLFKEWIRRPLWLLVVFCVKLTLFASSRTWRDVIFTPNMLIVAHPLQSEPFQPAN